jgi:drug/metabolite transporter (DMT)-like permease
MNFVASLSGLSAVFLWAITPVIFKFGLGSVPISYLLVLRFAISVLILAPAIPRLFRKRNQITLVDLIFLQLILAFAFYSMGTALSQLPASFYIMVFSLSPLLSLIAFRFRLSLSLLGPLALMGVGTLAFVTPTDFHNQYSAVAIAWLSLGMVLWVGYTRLVAKFHQSCSDLEVTTITNLLCLTGCLTWWGFEGLPVAPLNLTTWAIVILFGLISPLAFFSYSLGVRKAPLITIAAQYLDPGFGVGGAWLLLGESITTLQIIGVVVTMGGLAWLGVREARSADRKEGDLICPEKTLLLEVRQ